MVEAPRRSEATWHEIRQNARSRIDVLSPSRSNDHFVSVAGGDDFKTPAAV